MQAPTINIDLHWQLVGLARDRRHFNLDVDAMLARRRQVQLGDRSVGAFDAEDQLLHVALHAGMGGARRIDNLRDIAVLVTHDTLDWDEFVRRCVDARVRRIVGHTIDRATRAVGVDLPDDVVPRLVAQVDGRRRRDRRPPSEVVDGNAFGRATVSVQRDQLVPSIQARLQMVRDAVATRLGHEPQWDAGDVDGPLYVARNNGDASTRRAYLEYAASGR